MYLFLRQLKKPIIIIKQNGITESDVTLLYFTDNAALVRRENWVTCPALLWYLKSKQSGTWVAQSVKHLTLDLSVGLDLRVMSSSPMLSSNAGRGAYLKKKKNRGAWVAQVVKHLPLAEVMIPSPGIQRHSFLLNQQPTSPSPIACCSLTRSLINKMFIT